MSYRSLGLTAILLLALAAPARAVYQPERFGDPSRRWAVSARFSSEFDDNLETTSTNKISGFRHSAGAVAQANLPLGQTYVRGRYQYAIYYTEDRAVEQVDQSHSFDVLVSHTFTPRLVLDLTDSFRRGIEPELVEVQAGEQVELRRRGDFFYNDAAANLSYKLSRRWNANLRGGWTWWRFDESIRDPNTGQNIGPSINDRDAYRATTEFICSLTPRTFAGAGYQLSVIEYVDPGGGSQRDSVGHTGYATLTHTFNPRLSFSSTAGYEFREFGDGAQDGSPSVSAALNYTFARNAQATLGFNYAIATTELGGFRSSDSATLYGRASYLFTQKLRGSIDGLYGIAAYRNPVPPNTGNPEEQFYRLSLSLHYSFTRWAGAFMSYNFDSVSSDLAGRDFDRNRVSVGFDLTY